MPLLQAFFLGLWQGVCALLPMDGTGQTILLSRLLGASAHLAHLKALTAIEGGTLLALLLLGRREVQKNGRALIGLCRDGASRLARRLRRSGPQTDGAPLLSTARQHMAFLLAVSWVASLPVLLITRRFAARADGNLLLTAMGFLLTALLLFIASFTQTPPRRRLMTDWRAAAALGAVGGLALFPGISRVAVMLAVAWMCGYSQKYARRFVTHSVTGILALSLAVEFTDHLTHVRQAPGFGPLAAAVAGAAIGGVLFALMRRLWQKRFGRLFAIWSAAVGIWLIVLYL